MKKMTAKIAVYTIGTWPGQVEKLEDELASAKVFGGKFSGEERLLQHAKKGRITHLLVSHESALTNEALRKLKEFDIKIMNIRDVGRLL